MITDADRRHAARFLRDIWCFEKKARRRRPHASETVISAFAAATAILDSFVGNPFRFLGAPREVRCCLASVTGGGARPPAQLADQAEATLRYLDEAGDSTARPESIAIDRRILAEMAKDYFKTWQFNESDIARKVGISHTSVRDRRLARAARIMADLHKHCPDIWSAKGRPVITPAPDAIVLMAAA